MKEIVIVFSTLFLSLSLWAQSAPQTERIKVSGLKGIVTVRRDARSIPYIEAKSDEDLYFAQGYITASDRLWQMDLLRRVARGETAEIFGKTTLEEDKRWRRFGFGRIAEESLQYLLPESRAALENYARGVNAYIATLNEKTLPVEFRILQYRPAEWKTTDPIVIGKILSDALSSTWRQDLLKAALNSLPKEKFDELVNRVTPYDVLLFGNDVYPERQPPTKSRIAAVVALDVFQKSIGIENDRRSSLERVGLYAEDLAASNNWVISGKRTADGKPILANDPHLQPNAPGIWYLTELTGPNMRVSGVTVPGVPGLILGHNENIAWGATNVGPDVQDIYFETFNEKGEYKTPKGWESPVTRKEQIKVRLSPLRPDAETVEIEVRETIHGPIIFEDGGKKYALRWTARDPRNSEVDTFLLFNHATNWEDFKAAGKRYGGAMQNFVYADVKGNIGWYAMGRIPVRRVGNGDLPYDGATNDGDWTGYIPFDELPNLYNPREGFIVTANQRTVGTSYKYGSFSRDAAMPWRARRIYDRLKANTKITMDDVRDIQYDVTNIPLLSLAKDIVKLEAGTPETLAIIKGWDGQMTADSKAGLITNEIRNCLASRIADQNKPAPPALIRERILYWAVSQQAQEWLPKPYSNYREFILSCDEASRTSLADIKRLGADETKWVWGNVTRSRFPHPLAASPLIGLQFATPSVPISGSGQTPNVGSFVSMRHITSPGNWDATRQVIPLGESGDPSSPFYTDEFEAWRTGAAKIFPFSAIAVKNAAKTETVLTP